MPKIIQCPICGAKSPRMSFGDRMSWLKKHYKQKHPSKSREGIRRVRRTDKQ